MDRCSNHGGTGMFHVARKLNQAEPSYEVATVVAVEETRITVRSEFGDRGAERAASCLLAPAAGDEVAVLTTGDGRAFVIAILVRAAAEAALEIAVDGHLRISARGGCCQITATEDVELTSGRTMSLASKLLSLRAVEGSVVLSELTLLATSVLAHADGARIAAKILDWCCDRVSSTVKSSFRKVEELDQLRAERIDYRTEREICLRSENFLVGARKLAKLDAEQIHIG